jgi:Tol biopolymer transport system component
VTFLSRRIADRHQPPGFLSELRVTSNSPEASVQFPIVSPDGRYVAYSDPTGMYLRVIATGETRRWDLQKDFIADPSSWFPDGTHLLVTRWNGSASKPSLWKLSLLGGDARKLIDNAGYGSSVSPDGKRIAFVSDQPTLGRLPTPGRELWVMAADGSNPHKIAEADSHGSCLFSPAWAPDGQRIAYLKCQYLVAPFAPLVSIWTRDAEGSDPQEVVADARLGLGLAWAPDGRILFSSRSNPASERDDEDMRSIRVDERTGKAVGQQQVITTGTGTIEGFSVTSDGKRLVLWRTNTRDQAFISEFDAHTRKWKTPRRLTLDANGNLATTWLSDSKTILFVSNRNGTWTLFKQAIDETTADVLVEGRSLFLPRLSADGSQVFYGSHTGQADPAAPVSLMRVPVAGGPPQLVIQDVGLKIYQCARLPSTLCIIDKSQNTDCIVLSFDPERGIGRELLRTNDGCHNWSLSPDGRTLVAFHGGHSIRFYSLKNGAFRESNTATLSDWSFYNGDWNAVGTGVLIPSKTSSGTPVILEVDQTGKASVVLEGAANTGFTFMIPAPDGHHAILGAQVPGDNNAWMIDNF